MTRVLLPVLIAVLVTLLAVIALPIFFRELRYRLFGGQRAYELSKALEDLDEKNWER